ncbi:hypothetical protein [Aquiflexum sp.]|uniref:hypothetical protein n=1 Tax=Aquiflexum sp. TaxID=1872584 RepID=UPI00359421E6
MQIISHQNTSLSITQKFFIEKSIELLYLGTIDSYRVRLNNPKTILEELRYCLKEFNNGRIKHFHTIKGKEKKNKAIVDEAIELIKSEDNYLTFSTFSKEYFLTILRELQENDFKKAISCVDVLMKDNTDYIQNILIAIEGYIISNDLSVDGLFKIDRCVNFLFSELIHKGFAKGFLYRLFYGIFVKTLTNAKSFDENFSNFKERILGGESSYKVVFRIDTTQKVYEAISELTTGTNLELKDNIDEIRDIVRENREMANFNQPGASRKFLICIVSAFDFLSALKKAKAELSEYLDVINLGLSDETMDIHNRVLVIDLRSPERGNFQHNINFLDGKYKVEKEHYLHFRQKIPTILSNEKITIETKEKIKSAVRYLRLGNQSTEVEHKFINYWIGLEYLFSNYESQSTIVRLKDHFINAHSLAYTKRNIYSFLKAFNQLSSEDKVLISSYSVENNDFLKQEDFYGQIESELLNKYPLLTYRAMRLKKWFFSGGERTVNAKGYIESHMQNLEIHFTRIYRLRNEIIHDAATNTNNELITSNLRYYLTFILNELITFFSENHNEEISMEDFFILNEMKLGNIKHAGYKLEDLLSIDCSIDFIS